LLPHFTKGLKAAPKPINAQAETVTSSGIGCRRAGVAVHKVDKVRNEVASLLEPMVAHSAGSGLRVVSHRSSSPADINLFECRAE
jgi:hypothetical protein